MIFKGQNALCCRKDVYFGAHCTNLNEDIPIQYRNLVGTGFTAPNRGDIMRTSIPLLRAFVGVSSHFAQSHFAQWVRVRDRFRDGVRHRMLGFGELGFGELGRSPAFGELGFGELGRNPPLQAGKVTAVWNVMAAYQRV